jgi:hypothetical protein
LPPQSQTNLAVHRSPISDWLPTLLGAVAICALYASLALGNNAPDHLIEEDGPIEWLGSLGLFAGAGLFFAAFLLARRRGPASGLSRLGTWLLLALALALFVAGGEEISWGQRLLGFATPESIAKVNAQDETTLHNLTELQSGVFDGDRLFKLAWMGLFVALPVLAALWPRARAWLQRTVPLVPLKLSALFVLAWVAGAVASRVLDGPYESLYPLSHAVSEVQEAIVEVLAGVGALTVWLRLRATRLSSAQPPPAPTADPRPAHVATAPD